MKTLADALPVIYRTLPRDLASLLREYFAGMSPSQIEVTKEMETFVKRHDSFIDYKALPVLSIVEEEGKNNKSELMNRLGKLEEKFETNRAQLPGSSQQKQGFGRSGKKCQSCYQFGHCQQGCLLSQLCQISFKELSQCPCHGQQQGNFTGAV